MFRWRESLLLACVVSVCWGCSGTSSQTNTSPTQPSPVPTTPALPAPTITVQVSYQCNPCLNDPDNYILGIDCPANGVGACAGRASNQNPSGSRSFSWTGPLAVGRHVMYVEVRNVETLVNVTFSSNASSSGGLKRESLRVTTSQTASVDTYGYSSCSAATAFKQRPTAWFETEYQFEIGLASQGGTC